MTSSSSHTLSADIPGPSGFTYNPPAYTHNPGGRSVNSDVDSSDWTRVLEDLQTCGQSRLLRQIERNLQMAESELGGNGGGLSPSGPPGGMLGLPLGSPHNKSPSPASNSNSSRFDDLFGFQSQFQEEISSIIDLAPSGGSSQGGTSSTTPSYPDPPRAIPGFGLQVSDFGKFVLYRYDTSI